MIISRTRNFPKMVKRTVKAISNTNAKKPKIEALQKLPEDYINSHSTEFIKGINHILTIDPSLYNAITSNNFTQFESEAVKSTNEAFLRLIWTIIGQQISGKAAKAIENRFVTLFKGEEIDSHSKEGRSFALVNITPEQVVARKTEELRSCGLSARKVSYVLSICEAFKEDGITIEFLNSASDQDVIDKLVELKGIGEWSAKMFLIFALHRMDVFTALDLGISKGFSKYIETRTDLLKPIEKEIDWSLYSKAHFSKGKAKRTWKIYHEVLIDKYVERFQPFRSIFMFILWRFSSTELGQFD